METVRRVMVGARRSGRVVEVWRRRVDPHPLRGVVVDVARELALLHRLSDAIHLDGYSVVRVADVSRVDAGPDRGRFYSRALALRREKARLPKGINLSGMGSAISTAATLFPLVTLHRERISPDTCSIGRLRTLTEKSVTLKWLTPTAKWSGDSQKYRLADISLLEFGGEYEDALARVAGLRRPAI